MKKALPKKALICAILVLATHITLSNSTSYAQAMIDGCPVFPADNPWNQDISDTTKFPTHRRSDIWINTINQTKQYLHPDFGSPIIYGIPYEVVGANQPFVPITFDAYGDESDPGPYPIPPDAIVEGGGQGDSHVLVVDTGNCKLYELYDARENTSDNGWTAGSGAIWDLTKNWYRPQGWTSADAAGLPIFPGLVRRDEILAGEIKHAVRFTVPKTMRGFILPATHYASNTTDSTYPPMGLRLRLKADYDISRDTGAAKILLVALKKYGMILADNGSAWFISGATDTLWDDNDLSQIKKVPGSAFEAVYTGETILEPQASVNAWSNANDFYLEPNTPNPFFGNTTLTFTLANSHHATLRVYDALGRAVTTLMDGVADAGSHTVRFSAVGLAPGFYIARLESNGRYSQRTMQLIR